MSHVREHHSLLAAGEKRLLVWMASRLPRGVTSDRLTALALIAMIVAGASFAAIQTAWWSSIVFVGAIALNWFGDSLDGTVARVRDQQRPRYGYYVDHVIDLAGTAALVGGMAASGAMTPAVAFALLAAYCLVSAESYLATHAVGVFRLSFAGIGPSELRIILAIGAVRVAVNPSADLFGHRFLLLDVGGIVATAGLLVAFVAASVRNTRSLYLAEPLPRPCPRERAA